MSGNQNSAEAGDSSRIGLTTASLSDAGTTEGCDSLLASSARLIGGNIKRLMAQAGMTYEDLIEATGVDGRTIRTIVRGERTPQARTVHRLAVGLGVTTDELFSEPVGRGPEAFDVATNPIVDQVRLANPAVFREWSPEDFVELNGQFGVGGQLTESGALKAAEAINRKREVLRRARLVMETKHSELLSAFVDVLFDRATITE